MHRMWLVVVCLASWGCEKVDKKQPPPVPVEEDAAVVEELSGWALVRADALFHVSPEAKAPSLKVEGERVERPGSSARGPRGFGIGRGYGSSAVLAPPDALIVERSGTLSEAELRHWLVDALHRGLRCKLDGKATARIELGIDAEGVAKPRVESESKELESCLQKRISRVRIPGQEGASRAIIELRFDLNRSASAPLLDGEAIDCEMPPSSRVVRIVKEHGDWIEVEVGAPSLDHCRQDVEGMRGLGLTLFVQRSDLLSLTTEKVSTTYRRDQVLVLAPGVPVAAGAGGVCAGGHLVSLPAAKVGLTYESFNELQPMQGESISVDGHHNGRGLSGLPRVSTGALARAIPIPKERVVSRKKQDYTLLWHEDRCEAREVAWHDAQLEPKARAVMSVLGVMEGGLVGANLFDIGSPQELREDTRMVPAGTPLYTEAGALIGTTTDEVALGDLAPKTERSCYRVLQHGSEESGYDDWKTIVPLCVDP